MVAATYNEVYSWENLRLAYRKAAAAFEYLLADNLLVLRHELLQSGSLNAMSHCPRGR